MRHISARLYEDIGVFIGLPYVTEYTHSRVIDLLYVICFLL